MKKVTILITNYNYGVYLSRCIRSCLAQTMSKEEYDILVVDDKSNDCSREILSHWDGKYNIKVIYNDQNIGLGASCRIGVKNCETPYIVRVDADDYISEDFCKFLYVYASTNKSHAVACDYYKVDFDENMLNHQNHTNLTDNVAWGDSQASAVHAKSINKWKNTEDKDRINEVYKNNLSVNLLKRLNYVQ